MRPRQESRKLQGSSNGSMNKISSTTSTNHNSISDNGVRYRECRKNHAANIGGYAVDGCREFMASGEEGTSASLKCAACSCHRNFHRRELVADQNDESQFDCSSNNS